MVLPNNPKILELGAGHGMLWTANKDRIPEDWNIVISDLSEGMLFEAQNNLGDLENVFTFKAFDCQKIPFPDKTFDCVIANHMLYHVPDILKALSEIRRVLLPGGCLYAATNGSTHMQELYEIIRRHVIDFEYGHKRFTLENGRVKLESYFGFIYLLKYHNSLLVNDPLALIDYVRSMIGLVNATQKNLKQIEKYLYSSFDADGEFYISKSVGLFKAH